MTALDSPPDFLAFAQSHRLLTLSFAPCGSIDDNLLLPQELSGAEGFTYTLICLSADAFLELKQFLGLPVQGSILTDGGDQLPGWYGFGTAVYAFLERDKAACLELLQRMNRRWPFFSALLSNMDMVLAKSDIAIASRYSELVADAALRERIFSCIHAEHETTIAALKAITGQTELQKGNPLLKRSIRNRFPYFDPLNHVQVELLRQFRQGCQDERVRLGIHLSINGIAAGLRNSG